MNEDRLAAGQIELFNHQKLFAQLIGLIRKGEKIDHANGDHDHSNSAAGCLLLASAVPQQARMVKIIGF